MTGCFRAVSCDFTRSHVLFEVGLLLLVHFQRANELVHVSTENARGVELSLLASSVANGKAPVVTAVFMYSYIVQQVRTDWGDAATGEQLHFSVSLP